MLFQHIQLSDGQGGGKELLKSWVRVAVTHDNKLTTANRLNVACATTVWVTAA